MTMYQSHSTYKNEPLVVTQGTSLHILGREVEQDLAASPAYMATRQPSQSLPASSIHAARPPLYETEDSSKPPDYLTSNLQAIWQRSVSTPRYHGSEQPDTRRGHPSTHSAVGRYDNYWENIEPQRAMTSETLRQRRCTRRKQVYAVLLAVTIVILVLCLTTTIRWRAGDEEDGSDSILDSSD